MNEVKSILQIFGEVTGLNINYRKTLATLIHCDIEDGDRITNILECGLAKFPIKYLGLKPPFDRLHGTSGSRRLMVQQISRQHGKEG